MEGLLQADSSYFYYNTMVSEKSREPPWKSRMKKRDGKRTDGGNYTVSAY
ncbi:hypothetical protein V6Z11_A10G171700 [Gossypium hirsutum]